MLARVIGALVGLAVFLTYFSLIGTTPVWEVFVGVALTLAAGIWVWRVAARWLGEGGDRRT